MESELKQDFPIIKKTMFRGILLYCSIHKIKAFVKLTINTSLYQDILQLRETAKHFAFADDYYVEFLKMSFNAISYVFLINHSRNMAHYCHVIYACYQNILQNLLASC